MRSRNASMSTLANYKEKASKFQRALNLINVVVIIEAIFLINQGFDLFNFYHLGQLSFWCHFFVWFPTSVCALGVFLLITAMFSIGVANQPNSNNLSYRILLGLIAVLYCVAFLGTIFVIFCTVKLESCIQYSNPPADTVLNHLKQYGKEKTVTDDWDKLQRDLRCCGGFYRDKGKGYEIWNSLEPTNNSSYLNWNPESDKRTSVPDSCCIPKNPDGEITKGCGKCIRYENPNICKTNPDEMKSRILEATEQKLPEEIWINSCVFILVERIKTEVQPYIWYYALAGTCLALEAIIIAALASAYISAINRRVRREDKKYEQESFNE